jgi:hypothetical protein
LWIHHDGTERPPRDADATRVADDVGETVRAERRRRRSGEKHGRPAPGVVAVHDRFALLLLLGEVGLAPETVAGDLVERHHVRDVGQRQDAAEPMRALLSRRLHRARHEALGGPGRRRERSESPGEAQGRPRADAARRLGEPEHPSGVRSLRRHRRQRLDARPRGDVDHDTAEPQHPQSDEPADHGGVPGTKLVARKIVGDTAGDDGDDQQRADAGDGERRLPWERSAGGGRECGRRQRPQTERGSRLSNEEGRTQCQQHPAEQRPARTERCRGETFTLSADEPAGTSDQR